MHSGCSAATVALKADNTANLMHAVQPCFTVRGVCVCVCSGAWRIEKKSEQSR